MVLINSNKGGFYLKSSQNNSPYIISFDTFIIQPIMTPNKIESAIIERNQEITSFRRPSQIVRKSCYYYGNSFQSIINSSKRILGKSHKLPIVIAHDFGQPLVFFPTMSPTSIHTEWIGLHAIRNITPSPLGCTIHLENDRYSEVMVSEATLHRQYTLATLLKHKYQKRLQRMNQWMIPNPLHR